MSLLIKGISLKCADVNKDEGSVMEVRERVER